MEDLEVMHGKIHFLGFTLHTHTQVDI